MLQLLVAMLQLLVAMLQLLVAMLQLLVAMLQLLLGMLGCMVGMLGCMVVMYPVALLHRPCPLVARPSGTQWQECCSYDTGWGCWASFVVGVRYVTLFPCLRGEPIKMGKSKWDALTSDKGGLVG
jgi:hypothetical protein